MTNNTPLNADDEIDAVLEQAFTDGASDTMWQNDRHVEIFAEAKRRLLADRKKHELQARIDEARKIYANYIPAGTLVGKAVLKRIKRYKQELESYDHR